MSATTDTAAVCKACHVTKPIAAQHWYLHGGRYRQPCRPCWQQHMRAAKDRDRAQAGPRCPYCRELLAKVGRAHGHGVCGRVCAGCTDPHPMLAYQIDAGTSPHCKRCRVAHERAKAGEFRK